MKYLRFLGAAAVLYAAIATASAADLVPIEPPVAPPLPVYDPGFYLRGDIGWSFMDTKFLENDDNLTVGVGVGYNFTEIFRADLTGDYSGSYDIGLPDDMNVWTVLGNAYVGVPIIEEVTPYVGLGVGWGWLDAGSAEDDGFALALHAGFSFAVLDNLDLDIGYRFRDIMVTGADFKDHSLRAGFRIGF
ncbi:opacity protein-like surface antigen [Rhodoligotrophos appendicifer]|uniref:outer membrane protein n=1 Tax=Rhodoligotrophos appendicifer TaxID=987056 RepID=UPI001478FC62|nr:outer membrane beta-barrel protein [Rhodoligotrophos appendicifer]